MKLIKNRYNQVYSGIKISLFFLFYLTFLMTNHSLLSNLPYNYFFNSFIEKTLSVVMLIIAFSLVHLFEHRAPREFGIVLTKKTFKDFFLGLLLGALSIILIACILFMTNNAKLNFSMDRPVFSFDILYIFLMFIMVGIDEELLVRGYFVHTLGRYNPIYIVYIAPAIIFSALHLLNPNVSIFGLINIILVGVLFTYMTLKTKNILMAVGFHITWNFFQGGFFGFNVSGNTVESLYPVTVINNNILTGGDFGLEGGILTTILIVIVTLIVYKLPQKELKN